MADCKSPDSRPPLALYSRAGDVPAYPTRDGSFIEELMHPDHHDVRGQSLARATITAGHSTRLHRHRCSEEVYHILAGAGWMTLGEVRFPVSVGDTIVIPPGTPHRLEAGRETDLVILCACAPAYSHQDTELLDGDRG